jgi:hypothetical protein
MSDIDRKEKRTVILHAFFDQLSYVDFNPIKPEDAVAFLLQTIADYYGELPVMAKAKLIYIAIALYKSTGTFARGETKAKELTDSLLDSFVHEPIYRV